MSLCENDAGIARKHGVSIANVATRYILDKPAVAGVIVGVRLGLSDHHADNARVFALQLDASDLEQIDNILSRSNDLYDIIGDCGAKAFVGHERFAEACAAAAKEAGFPKERRFPSPRPLANVRKPHFPSI